MRLSKEVTAERVAHYRAQMQSIVGGRLWLVADALVVSGAKMGAQLLSLGAEAVLVIAGSRGTGDVAEDERMSVVDLALRSTGLLDGIRGADAALRNLATEARATVEAFDPTHEAQAVGTIWMSGTEVAGRPLLGARPQAWQDLEDKLVAAALWGRAGIPHAPSTTVPAELDALRRAAGQLDQGLGTVWVGDNKEGWHGGATMLRWVRSPSDETSAHDFLAAHADKVRVMPFVDGIPCSIHAFVTSSQVSSIRPCEMLVFRQQGSTELYYSGASTNWIPSPAQSALMHEAVRKVGETIRSEVDYRGSFTLDGICNQEGFFPTEINPRYGGALSRMTASMPDLPLYLVHSAMCSGLDLDFRPLELAELIASVADANPEIRGMALLPGLPDIEPGKTHITTEDGAWTVTEDEEAAQGYLKLGPFSAGQIVFANVDMGVIPHGISAAPVISETLMLASRHFGFELPALIPAPDLR